MKNKSVKYASMPFQKLILERMVLDKADGYIKRGTFTDEVVWGNYSYIFPKMDKKKQAAFKKGMFLFGMVRRDAKIFLKNNPVIKMPKKYPQMEYTKSLNEELFGKIVGTDLNHAYWRIAYNLGILSDQTYSKGLDDSFKAVRLAALSTLGANKKYQKIRKGVFQDDMLIIKGDEELQKIYIYIRLTCYKYMNQVKKLIGKDFLCYKTDAIYYIDTKENRKKVNDFFKQKELLMKQLT